MKDQANHQIPTRCHENPGHPSNVTGQSKTPQEQREMHLARLQTEALALPDPMLANLQILAGEVMRLAHEVRAGMQADADRSATSVLTRGTAQAELFLKCVRQADRLAQLKRQWTRPGAPES